MHFAVISYNSIEQGLVILFMSKAVQLNQKEYELNLKTKVKGE